MGRLSFATGLKVYEVNDSSAKLRFNPGDMDTYNRLREILVDIEAMGQELSAAAAAVPDNTQVDRYGVPVGAIQMAELMRQLDVRIKERLTYAFGCDNDFNAIFDGLNAFSMTDTGKVLVYNFIDAVQPIFEQELKAMMDKKVAESKQNRAQRRAGR